MFLPTTSFALMSWSEARLTASSDGVQSQRSSRAIEESAELPGQVAGKLLGRLRGAP
jgi:hypothetical protein